MYWSRSILYKAARLSRDEFEQVQKHVDLGVQMLKPVGGPLLRVIPIILAIMTSSMGPAITKLKAKISLWRRAFFRWRMFTTL